MKLLVELLSDTAKMPTRAHENDSGFDLYTSEDTTVFPNTFVDVPCGIAVQLPPGVWAMLTGRSSTLRSRRLLVHTAIIDNGYRGPLFAGVWNMSKVEVVVAAGDRLAQLIPMSLLSADIRVVEAKRLGGSDRGTAGFGSSGC